MYQKILFIIPSLNYGGAEVLLVQQVKWLTNKGNVPYIAILSKKIDSELIKELGLPEDHLIILNSPSSVLNSQSILFAIKQRSSLINFVNNFKIQNIIAHLPLAHWWGRLIKRKLPGTYLLVYHHSMQYQANPLNTKTKIIFNNIQKRLAKKTDDVSICISNAVKENIAAHFILNNPIVLFNAVPNQSLVPLAKDKTNEHTSTSIIKIVIPGRLHPAKGHLFFLKVFKQLIQDLKTPIKLTIAGGGPLEGEIDNYIKKNGLHNNVTVTGSLPNNSILKEMANSHFVIIPSISEGLGIVAIEALMLGKTTISSNTGGLKEIFVHGKNGYLFQSEDYSACLSTMYHVLSNISTSILDPAILRDDYLTRFSFDVYMENLTRLLKK